MTPRNYDPNDIKRGEEPNDIPAERRAWEARQGERARRSNVGTGGIARAKALIATGAVAGALGGWPLFAQQTAATSAQIATPSPAVAALALTSTATSTSTPQPGATPAGQFIVTSLPSTATPTLKAASTSTSIATSTSTPSPTAIPQATATPVPAPVTNTRSSR